MYNSRFYSLYKFTLFCFILSLGYQLILHCVCVIQKLFRVAVVSASRDKYNRAGILVASEASRD